MGNFLEKASKKKGPAITDTDRTILTLKTQKRKLEDQEKLIAMRLERHAEVARQLAAEGKRERALLALKKKKLSENQMMTLHSHIINVENMLLNIESTKNQANVFALLKNGNDALKQLQAQVKIDDVQKLMEETAEAAEYQKELAAVLGEQLSSADDEAVEEELAALEEVVADEEKLELPNAPKVPAAAGKVKQPTAGEAAQEAGAEQEEQEPQRAEPMAAV